MVTTVAKAALATDGWSSDNVGFIVSFPVQCLSCVLDLRTSRTNHFAVIKCPTVVISFANSANATEKRKSTQDI